MKFEIKNRWNGELIFSVETDSWKLAVEAAVKARADLTSANLTYADLTSADLTYADLRYADLTSADLTYANLRYANLNDVRNDFWSILLFAQPEIKEFRKALVDGKIDGSVYKGDCVCLVGTIANIRKCDVNSFSDNLAPDSSRPAERFFMGIKKGDTPKNNPVSKIALGWLDTFAAQIK